MRRRLLRALVVLVTLLLLGWGWASVDRCGAWAPQAPRLVGVGRGSGPLRVGAAVVAVKPPYPITVAGYGPPRPTATATAAAADVTARATVVEVGGQAVALVVVDTLLVTASMRVALQRDAGLPLWLAATHTHSSLGGYDARLAPEVAAVGRYRADAEAAVLDAAKAAVAQARARLVPARLEVTQAEASGLAVARSGAEVDHALTRLRFVGEAGPVAQWLVLSAHPTLVSPRADALDPDWPGRLGAGQEARGGPVTLVLQGAGGNASVDRRVATTPDAFAASVAQRLEGLTAAEALSDVAELAWADVVVGLPRPDATRLIPAPLQAAAENALCEGAERDVVLSALRVGPASLLLVPVEPSAAAGQVLAQQAGATRVLSLVNGYAGYLELEATARAGEGEARRQYFEPGLLSRLADGARLAGQAVAAAR